MIKIHCKRTAILTYHSISIPPKNTAIRSTTVSPRKLAWHFRLLKWLGYRAISMTELLPYLTGEKTGKVVGLTFDDGYLDNYQYALPLLKKYGFTATCYLISERIGDENRWDFDKGVAKRTLMQADHIREWIASGNEIGAHTLTHPDLKQLTGEALSKEIVDSKQQLEQLVGQPIHHFSYPYGRYHAEAVEVVQKAGFQTAVTTDRGRVETNDDVFTLPRVNIPRTVMTWAFLSKAIGGYEDRRRAR